MKLNCHFHGAKHATPVPVLCRAVHVPLYDGGCLHSQRYALPPVTPYDGPDPKAFLPVQIAGEVIAGISVSDAAFKAVFDLAPEAISLARLHDGVILEVNTEWQALTGFAREEVVGRTALDIGFWPDARTREGLITAMRQHSRISDTEVSLRMRDGALRLVRMTASVVQVGAQSLILSYFRDITAHRMAQEALRVGERVLEETNEKLNRQVKLYHLTESVANVGYWAHYPGDPVVHLSAGYAMLAGFGDQRSVLLEDHVRRVLPEDRVVFESAMQAMDGRTIEYRWRHPSGNILWMRSRMYRQIEQGMVRANMGVVQEVSAEKAALQATHDQLSFIQRITGRAPGMLFEFQTWSNERLEFHFASAGSVELLGVGPDALRADVNHLFRRIERRDVTRLVQEALVAARAGAHWQSEFLTRPLQGVSRWLLINALPDVQPDGSILWCGAITDITSQKEALARLQDSEARFRSLTELSSDWYWEQDANFRFVRVDGNLENSKALPAPNYVGKTRWESGAQGVSEEAWSRHRAQLEAHAVFHDFEMQRQRTDGTWMWVTLSGAPILDAQGQFKGYRGTGRDISARKRAEGRAHV